MGLCEGVDSQTFEVGWHSLTLGMDASSGTSVGAKETVDTSDSQPRGIWIPGTMVDESASPHLVIFTAKCFENDSQATLGCGNI